MVPQEKKVGCGFFTAQVLTTPAAEYSPPVPLDMDNGFPGIELWFGKCERSEVGLMCHLDSCAVMNTGNMYVHQWLMTTHPLIVAEYIQYDDSKPFQPLQLQCAVNSLNATESMHGKITAVLR